MSESAEEPEIEPAPVSRRGLLQTTLGAAAGTLLPSALDLNVARTRAGTPPQPNPSMTSAPFPNAPMTFEGVVAQARALAAGPYRAPAEDLPPALAALSYDEYRAITFRPDAGLRLGGRFSAQLFHRGFLHRKRVVLTVQPSNGPPRPVAYAAGQFDLGSALRGQIFAPSLGFAGFRLHYAFDAGRPEAQEEFLVFLGASYFRLRGAGQEYGLSARGVAVNTGGPGTEEFPDFTAFWILEPGGDETSITVLALLDGPSLSGAYRFVVAPGDPSRVAVTASLHPRQEIARLGLAPLTSMFLHGQNGPGARGAKPLDDFRPQVHDSDGLVVATPGDRLWRPLVNGRPKPQISAFAAAPLDGFGLLQRARDFSDYLDVQARHESRPGLWVAPAPAVASVQPAAMASGSARNLPSAGAFDAGTVQLFEIPSDEEYMDNVVAAFVPAARVEAGRPLALAYALATIGSEPDATLPGDLARVVSTRVGSAERLRPTSPPAPGRRLYVIDFEGPSLPSDPNAAIDVALSANAGAFVEPYTERVPQTGGWRLYAEYRPPDPPPPGDVVLRARLSQGGRAISETWDAVA